MAGELVGQSQTGTSPLSGNAPRRTKEEHVIAKVKKSDDEAVLLFQFQALKHFNVNRTGWLRRERALLAADRKAAEKHRRLPTPNNVVAATHPRPRWNDQVSDFAGEEGDPIEPVVRPTSPVQNSEEIRRTVTRKDKDFNSIPDYCPALSSLIGCGNLEIDWNYRPRDLDNDPHASLLHPVELRLAEILRLDCATYLTSKRRIFQRRLECFRVGKKFLKTDAQRACKIDVNKTSRLWIAFRKVGWLRKGWMRRFL